MSDSIPATVERGVDELVGTEIVPEASTRPMYRVDPQTKIPVSNKHGKLWKSRIDAACTARKQFETAWDEATRYYNNNQLEHRTSNEGVSGNRYVARKRNTHWSETENIVYANIRAMMPALYAKNPQVEFTPTDEADKPLVKQVETLVNTLATLPNAPGLNLKVHGKQAVLSTEICNIAWLEYGYVQRDQSVLAAQDELERITKQLTDAKDMAAIREAEGQLMALEEQLDILTSPGPFVKFRTGKDVVCDPDATMPDFSDTKWRAVYDLYPTDYLNAVYGERKSDGTYKSVFEPTHVLLGSSKPDEQEFQLFDKNADAKQYGYSDKDQLEKAYRTRCVRILDKVTRRVYLYADNKWDWPIWVENDPYNLPGFFNLEPMYFNTTISGAYAPSNVTYYLDQQDAINEINDEFRRARQDVKENILYDEAFDRNAIISWLNGGGPNAQGVRVPDGRKMSDMIVEKPNVMLKAMQLFDLERPMRSIDRISGVSDVLRNVQFKTNTTNRAIENYNSSTALRLDEKIDAIEDCFGRVLYGVAHLCLQFMPVNVVTEIIGERRAEGWTNKSAKELRGLFTCQAIGGSTQKPTSEAKKQQALQISQILEKLAQFAPTVAITTILTLLEEAFDEVDIPDDAFEQMKEEVQLAMQRGNSTQGAGSSPEGTMPQGGNELEQLAQAIDTLPPEVKLALGKIIAQGVPIAEALPQVLQAAQNSGVQQGM